MKRSMACTSTTATQHQRLSEACTPAIVQELIENASTDACVTAHSMGMESSGKGKKGAALLMKGKKLAAQEHLQLPLSWSASLRGR